MTKYQELNPLVHVHDFLYLQMQCKTTNVTVPLCICDATDAQKS